MNTSKAKVINKLSKKTKPITENQSLREQYDIIKNDLLKLREDLSKGYDLAKGLDKKGLVREILKTK